MSRDNSRIFLGVLFLMGATALFVAFTSPRYIADYSYLTSVIFAEAMLVSLWNYAVRVFPVLLGIFLWAGTDVPLSGMWASGRWYVLAIAALAGFAVFMHDRRHHFLFVHLVALFCVVSALISAMVSSNPRVAVLKALSLLLLFAYCTAGARLALFGREGKFCAGLLTAVELLIYVAAVAHFIVHYEFFGNPNSLGAVAGVVGMPVLLWGVLVSYEPGVRRRRMFALVLTLLLLLSSHSRAGIAAAAISCTVLCVSLKNYRLLVKGLTLSVMGALLVSVVAPAKDSNSGSLLDEFVYKGEEGGMLASRSSVWDETIASIRQRPWFGSGFGTVVTSYDAPVSETGDTTASGNSSREHGSSYLAIADWVGLLGVVPFFALVAVTCLNVRRVMHWLRRTGDPFSPAVPLAAILIAGLVHAAFEDWLFAVGYYLCPFFWSLAFMLTDVLPVNQAASAPAEGTYRFMRSAQLGYPLPER